MMLFSFLKAKASLQVQKLDKAKNLLFPFEQVLNFFDSEELYPEFHVIGSGVNEPICKIDDKDYLMFCSNNYLSLTEDADIKKAASDSIEKYGVGPGGSRAVSGTVDIIVELEEKIAKLTGMEDCLTFPTGYMANVGVVKAIMDSFFQGMPYKTEESAIFSDEYNHGSIVDGCRLSRAKKVVFKHNDLEDLRIKLRANNLPHKLIITEGVFSTEGEILDIDAYSQLAEEEGALLMIDDAHGVGVLGDFGGGTPQVTGKKGKIDILMGSMDKAFGGTGGYLCGKKELIRYLRVAMSSSILSSAIPTAAAAAMSVAVNKICSDIGREKRAKVMQNAEYLKRGLEKDGFRVLGNAQLPSVPLYIGKEQKALNFSEKLFEKGIFTTVFRWPAVPQGEARLRLTLMANHTREQLDDLLAACKEIGKEIGII